MIPHAEAPVMEMTIYAEDLESAYPQATTDLVAGSWVRIPHSYSPWSFIAGFVETNLLYSVASDTNVVIYVEADEEAKFFRIVE